jgi:hypothetical protein
VSKYLEVHGWPFSGQMTDRDLKFVRHDPDCKGGTLECGCETREQLGSLPKGLHIFLCHLFAQHENARIEAARVRELVKHVNAQWPATREAQMLWTVTLVQLATEISNGSR